MMTDTEALHTAARHYCIDRAMMWRQRHVELDRAPIQNKRHPEEELGLRQQEVPNLYPRYEVLDAILAEVEKFVPNDFSDFDEARSLLCLAGQTAQSVSIERPQEGVAREAIVEERDLFCRHLQDLSERDLRVTDSLPFRRVLTARESQELWEKLRDHWDVKEHYWHPLVFEDMPPNVLGFQADWFHSEVPAKRLQEILASHGVSRLWELREYGADYEMDLELLEPFYNGAEGYWTSSALDWLIYASHESSLTVAGEWLIQAVQSVWPDWHLRLYSGWDYEPPLRQSASSST